jgi:hypothetical protein
LAGYSWESVFVEKDIDGMNVSYFLRHIGKCPLRFNQSIKQEPKLLLLEVVLLIVERIDSSVFNFFRKQKRKELKSKLSYRMFTLSFGWVLH